MTHEGRAILEGMRDNAGAFSGHVVSAGADIALNEIDALKAALKSCVSWMPNCPARTEAKRLLSGDQ